MMPKSAILPICQTPVVRISIKNIILLKLHEWSFNKMARPERFELPTARFVAEYSIQLSYGRIFDCSYLRIINMKRAIIANNPIGITYIIRYSIYSESNRRGARVVDWGSLLRSCTGDRTEGSNPSLSAI